MAASAKQAAWALAPAFAVLFAFWLLPLAHLMVLGAESRDSHGSGYWQVLGSAQYLGSLAQTCVLALVVTFAALLVGGVLVITIFGVALKTEGARPMLHVIDAQELLLLQF